MTEDYQLNADQQNIEHFVTNKADGLKISNFVSNIPASDVEQLVKSLKHGVAPGCDGITVEHLYYGLSSTLCTILADLYNITLSTSTIPEVLRTGIIIPILKKPSLDPNKPEHYRPITLSSVHSKLFELLILPNDTACNTQFGFRKGRGTSFVTSLINDTASYFNSRGSPIYMFSLDAEKCFDNI